MSFTRHFVLYSQGLVVIQNKSYNNNFHLNYDSIYKVKKMNIRTTIEENYKSAIKNKKITEINTLRLIKSAIKDKDIASRSSNKKNELINDSEILSLLQSLIKQRNDSIDSFKLAAREDLVIIEQSEIDIIIKFLPKQKNAEETEQLISVIIEENSLDSLKDMGKLMNIIKSQHAGSIDMALVGKIAKSKLSS